MSLLNFHRFLIGAAIIFCGGYSVWEMLAANRGEGSLVVGAVFVVLTLGLSVYLLKLRTFLGYEEGGSSAG